MKTLFGFPKALTSVVMFLSIFVYASCGQDNPVSHGLSDAKKATESFVDGDFKGEYYKGRVAIRGAKSNELVVSLDSKANSDGIANQLYILQIEKNVKDVSGVDFSFDKAEVMFFKSFLIVNSLNSEKTLYFTLNREEGNAAFSKLPSAITGKINEKFSGYGLAQAAGSWPVSLDFLKDANDTYEALDKYAMVKNSRAGARALAECASGGTGSTSCSLSGSTGCSVTCSAGKYACCNYVVSLQQQSGCKCK